MVVGTINCTALLHMQKYFLKSDFKTTDNEYTIEMFSMIFTDMYRHILCCAVFANTLQANSCFVCILRNAVYVFLKIVFK